MSTVRISKNQTELKTTITEIKKNRVEGINSLDDAQEWIRVVEIT